MKHSLLIAAAALAAFTVQASVPQDFRLPDNFDPMNLNYKWSPEELQKLAENAGGTPSVIAAPAKKKSLPSVNREAAQKKTLQLVAQKFHKGYTFNYNGGDVVTYEVEVTINGNTATINNFFNLEAQSTSYQQGYDYEVTGVYDPDARTITFPIVESATDGTIVGAIGTSYTEILMAGTVTPDGKLVPDDELVLYVNEDFTSITTKQNVGIINWYTSLGMNFGFQTLYRSMEMILPTDAPKFIAFNNQFDLGETFINSDATVTATYVNASSVPADYVINVESDGNAFSANPAGGTAPAKSAFEVTYTFNAAEAGEYEGIANIEYETTTAGEPIAVLLNASAINYPDFSAIVKEGNFDFTTNIEFPFEPTVDEEGHNVARSGTGGKYGSSKLNVMFEVPEGQIGTFSWKGQSVNKNYWYQNASGYFVDDAPNPEQKWNGELDDISGAILFAPGKHTVRFQYDGLYYTGNPENAMTVYDLSLVCNKAPSNAAETATPNVDLGCYLIEKEGMSVQGQGTVRIRNLGMNTLSVKSVSSDNKAVSATVPSETAELLGYIDIPVYLDTDLADNVKAKLTISTTGGELTANITATVRIMDDFTPFVVEGLDYVTAITTNPANPFIINGTTIMNANSGMADNAYSDSWVKFNFTVPEGKAIYITFDGHSYGGHNPENQYSYDYAGVEISHPMTSGTSCCYDYDADCGSTAMFLEKAGWESYLTCIPGNHYITFHYYKNGDGYISPEDMVQFSNLSLKLEDFPEYGCEPDQEEVTFEPTYVGPERYTTAVVKLRNTGSEQLKVLDTRGTAPFYGVFKEEAFANFSQNIEVGIWFYPSKEGEYEGDVVFETTAGDITIHCIGRALSSDGTLIVGDFEDNALGWTIYDADGDGDCWNLATNFWGEQPSWVNSGVQCLASPSMSTYGDPLTPDNWTISPTFVMPENGKAVITWYVGAHHSTRYAEHYSAYCEPADEVADVKNLAGFSPLYSEDLEEKDAKEFRQVVVEVEGTPGKEYQLLFRHHDCTGEYVLKIDDVFVYTTEKWDEVGVGTAIADVQKVNTVIYDVNGIRHNELIPGINIVTDTYANGVRLTRKVVIK